MHVSFANQQLETPKIRERVKLIIIYYIICLDRHHHHQRPKQVKEKTPPHSKFKPHYHQSPSNSRVLLLCSTTIGIEHPELSRRSTDLPILDCRGRAFIPSIVFPEGTVKCLLTHHRLRDGRGWPSFFHCPTTVGTAGRILEALEATVITTPTTTVG